MSGTGSRNALEVAFRLDPSCGRSTQRRAASTQDQARSPLSVQRHAWTGRRLLDCGRGGSDAPDGVPVEMPGDWRGLGGDQWSIEAQTHTTYSVAGHVITFVMPPDADPMQLRTAPDLARWVASMLRWLRKVGEELGGVGVAESGVGYAAGDAVAASSGMGLARRDRVGMPYRQRCIRRHWLT